MTASRVYLLWARRALFVGLNFIAALAIFLLIWSPLQNVFNDRAAFIATQREALARWQAIAARDEDVKVIANHVDANTNQGELIAVANEGIASAELQARLKAMAEGAGAILRSVQSTSVRATTQVKYIGARIDIYGGIRAIHQAVHAIENARPYIFVTGAILKLSPLAGSSDGSVEPVIDAQLEVVTPMQLGER